MTRRTVGNISAFSSLVCALSFWLGFALSHAPRLPQLNLSPLHWLTIEGMAVVLAIVATILRSRLWATSLTLAVAMFLFTMYVIGS